MTCICKNPGCTHKEQVRLEWDAWLAVETRFWAERKSQDVCRCHGDQTPEKCIKEERNEEFNTEFWNAEDKYRQIPLRLELKMFRDSIPQKEAKEMRKTYLEQQKELLQTQIDSILSWIAKQDMPDWLTSLQIENSGFHNLKKQLKKVSGELEYVFNDKKQNSITEEDIENARTMDIMETGLIQKARHTGKGRYSTKCLWHEERSASMIIYPNGSFHCFGCQKSGSAIDIAMKVNDLTFIQSVKYLLGK